MTRALLAMVVLSFGSTALAYRPFDSTDADVAHVGDVELELGPLQWLRQGDKRFLHLPAFVVNVGLSHEHELVVEGRHEIALDREPDEPRSALVDDGAFIKQVLRDGVLQDRPGVSIATEYGVLLPEVNGTHGTGFSLAGIVSQRWEAATIHLNAVLARTREHEPALFLGTILEGPFAWALRPVAEIFTERAGAGPRTDSLLVGAIWRLRDGLSFDAGLRSARVGDDTLHELRLGLTWAFSYKADK
ncbi:MAG TPA: hypothetical protein VFJ70_04515 [Burkholderiales bacterium]|nr:hypothetical protein [Burkholderiales bacterium]